MTTITRAAVVGLGTMGRRSARDRVTRRMRGGCGHRLRGDLGDLSIKQDVLDTISRSTDAIIASNTSTFRAGVLAGFVDRPERLLLTHFFNPADIVPLVEVIRAPSTADIAVHTVLELLHRLGKRPVVAGDVEGFIANRLQAAVLREALSLVERGLAGPEDIDAVVRHGLGPRWSVAGPIGVADLGGLDVWEAVCAQIFPTLDNRSEPPSSIVDHVRAGRLGAKSGTGFYDHTGGGDQRLLAAMEELFTRGRS